MPAWRFPIGFARSSHIAAVEPMPIVGRRSNKGSTNPATPASTALGEIATVGWPAYLFFGETRHANHPATTVFLELLGLSAERTAANMVAAAEHLRHPDSVGLSPHAPYTVRPELVQQAAAMSRTARIPLAMHLAESPEEIQLLGSGDGPLYELLSEFGVWDPTAIPRGARPLDYLRLLAKADRALVIHGTYLDDEEIAFLAAHADRMSVVYCPRTHAYFPHSPYPLAKLLAAGVTVALGTDSRASNPDLNSVRRTALRRRAACNRAGSTRGLGHARRREALGRDQELGTIAPGKSADLTVVRLPDVEADPYELLFDPRSSVAATVRNGAVDRWCVVGNVLRATNS